MFGRKVALGAATIGAFQLLAKLFDLVAMLILARVLIPDDFGLVALAVAVLLVATAFTELPVIDALIQREELDPDEIDTAFTLNIARGLIVSTALAMTAYPAAAFYKDDRLISLIFVLSIVPIAQSLNSPAMVKFVRKVEYGPTARASIIGKAFGVTSTIILALVGASYWALITNLVVTAIVTMVTTHILAPYRPKLRLSGALAILQFAGWLTVSRIIWTLNMQSDRFLIGRLLGKHDLGQYTVGSDLSSMATYALASPILRPVFSGFSRIKNDSDRLRVAYLKTQQTLVMVALPFGVVLASAAKHIVPVVLGDGWQQAVPVVQWLAPVVALQMMSVPVQSAAMALGRPSALAWRELVGLAIRLPATLIAAWYYGLIAAAAARSLTGILIIIINLAIAADLIKCTVRSQLQNSWRSICSAIVMAMVIFALDRFLSGTRLPEMALAGFEVMAGLVSYTTCHAGLWFVAGRPDGSEQILIDLYKKRKVAI